MTWKTAFLRQARADLTAYSRAVAAGDRASGIFHLASAGEKVAKAFSPESLRNDSPKLSHSALRQFIVEIGLSPLTLRTAGYANIASFAKVKPGLVATATYLEATSPALANRRAEGDRTHTRWGGRGVNTEYPWAEAGGVVAPCDYAFSEPELSPVALTRLAELLRVLTDRVS